MVSVRQPGSGPSAGLGFEPLEDRTVPAAGFFDQTFGTAGISQTAFVRNGTFTNGGIANAIATQPDGKVIIAGQADSPLPGGDLDFAVVRLNIDGTLDPSFGSGGRVLIPFDLGGGNSDYATEVAVTSGGNILVGGTVDTGVVGNGNDYGFARLTPAGVLDTSFGPLGTGKFNFNFRPTPTFPSGGEDLRGLALQPDGKFVVTGFTFQFGFGVARFNANGVLDGSFNKTGQYFLGKTAGFQAYDGNDLVVQADGKIIIVGDTGNGGPLATNTDFGVIRLNADGTLDTTFGTNGLVTAGFGAGGGGASPQDVKINPADGSIVVAGRSQSPTSNGFDFAVARFTSAGVRDGSFNGGRATVGINLGVSGADDSATGVLIQPDGKIILTGTADPGATGTNRFAAARFLTNGQLDPMFGVNGVNSFNVGNQTFIFSAVSANALAFGPNGTFLIAGTNSYEMTVVRVTGDGVPGGGGGGGGFSSLFNSVIAASTDDGQIAAYGVSTPGSYNASIVVRLNSATVFNGYTGLVRTAVADVNGDTIPDFILVTGPGVPTQAAVVSGADQLTYIVPPFFPFRGSEAFTGGGYVSVGDLTGDAVADFIITPDQGGGPRVVVYSAVAGLVLKADFFGVTDSGFRGGAQTAVGDVNGDGTNDLAVAAGAGGGPRVAVFDGVTLLTTRTKLVSDFFALPNVLRNGVNISIGDVDGDGFADLVIGAGDGGASQVLILSGKTLFQNGAVAAGRAPINSFFVNGDPASRVGVRVSVRNVDGDKFADVVVGSGPGQASRLRVYLGLFLSAGGGEPGTFQDLDPFSTTPTNGVFVG